MVKGFKDGRDRFHPITVKKGVRKSREPKKIDGVKLHIKKHVEGIRLKRKVISSNQIEWGFDLTEFKPDGFQKLLKDVGIPEGDVSKDFGEDLDGNKYGRGFIWHGEGIEITTGNNPITGQYARPEAREPEVNYASYIGITGLPDLVKVAVRSVKKNTVFIKDESKNMRDFI